MSGEVRLEDMHFKTGIKGWCARFFAKRRAARDPFDQTVILPCIIFVVLARLNIVGRIDAWAVVAGLMISASAAGMSIGACFGPSAQFRAMLRGIFVGGIEGAASVGIAKEAIAQHDALVNAFNLMFINYVLFWFPALISSVVSEIATISEQQWQKGVPRRAYIIRMLQPIWQKLIPNAVWVTPFEKVKETSTKTPVQLPLSTIQYSSAQSGDISPEFPIYKKIQTEEGYFRKLFRLTIAEKMLHECFFPPLLDCLLRYS